MQEKYQGKEGRDPRLVKEMRLAYYWSFYLSQGRPGQQIVILERIVRENEWELSMFYQVINVMIEESRTKLPPYHTDIKETVEDQMRGMLGMFQDEMKAARSDEEKSVWRTSDVRLLLMFAISDYQYMRTPKGRIRSGTSQAPQADPFFSLVRHHVLLGHELPSRSLTDILSSMRETWQEIAHLKPDALDGHQGQVVRAMNKLAEVWENRHPGERFFPEEAG